MHFYQIIPLSLTTNMFNILVLFAFTVVAVSAKDQLECVSGQLSCSTNASAVIDSKVKIIIRGHDSHSHDVVIYTKMGNDTTPDGNGRFRLCTLAKVSALRINHTCNAKPGCTRLLMFQEDNFDFEDEDDIQNWPAGVIDLSQDKSYDVC